MFVIVFYAIILFVRSSNAEDLSQEKEIGVKPMFHDEITGIDMQKAIEEIESDAAIAEKSSRLGIVPEEDTEKQYHNMAETLDDVIESMINSNNAYKFLKAKGLDRVVATNIMTTHTELRTRLLVLMKLLFEIAPTTTTAVIPINIADGLLDIFENDNNLALKAHALDILYKWLPYNPKVQARIMKIKGLEPFYKPIPKLGLAVIQTLLDLFNKILNEHLEARSVKTEVTKTDAEKRIIYQRIGLIERMSTPMVCNGLFNIFEVIWSYNNKDNNVIITVFQLMKNIKPYCLKHYKGKSKAVELFDAILKYVKDENRKDDFLKYELNVTEVQSVIEDCVDKLKYSAIRDEF